MRVLLTGGTGFIGAAVGRALLSAAYEVVGVARKLPTSIALGSDPKILWHEVGSINNTTQWSQILQGVDTVVHCAARTHVMNEHAADALTAYREVNVAGTLRLAQQAAAVGVQRFVFLSSIKVNGEATAEGKVFTEVSPLLPEDPYGRSKAEAERTLFALADQTGMEVVVIRPPLVYGPGVKGNFARMLQWMKRGVPLPLGAVHNQRSLVALDNLVSLVLLCADRTCSPQAANQIFVVADGEDVSTTMLLQKMAQSAGSSSRLLPVPVCLLRAVASMLGKGGVAQRLTCNLQVDATKARMLLDWQPLVSMDEQLAKVLAIAKTETKE